ncbi:MAG: DUF4260 domain-containing protein [Leucobacter sp.]
MTERAPRKNTEVPGGTGRGLNPRMVQMVEGALIAAFALTGTVVLAPNLWWFPLAIFLVFDLSALGYLRSPATGARWYNAVHTYVWPALLGIAAFVTVTLAPEWSLWLSLVAFAWAFHVGVDRMLGYGLKLPDAFTHTHLGWIGKDRKGATPAP